MITLYDYELSSDCYKVRLLMAILGIAYERVELDYYPGYEHQGPAFLAVSPLGVLPAIDADGFLLHDAHAILGYLALAHDISGRWYCAAEARPEAQGRIAMWLAFAGRLSLTAAAARLHDALFHDTDIDQARAGAHGCLEMLDEHLWFAEREGQDWICSRGHPTIADIACFPDIMLCEEGGISRLPYPAVRRWTERVKRIPHFVPMSGIFGAAPLEETTA